jgi:hypothetical protein
MEYWEYSQAIADKSIAMQQKEWYHPPVTNGPSDVDMILKKYKLATNPVTKSVYRQILVNRITAKELE